MNVDSELSIRLMEMIKDKSYQFYDSDLIKFRPMLEGIIQMNTMHVDEYIAEDIKYQASQLIDNFRSVNIEIIKY